MDYKEKNERIGKELLESLDETLEAAQNLCDVLDAIEEQNRSE